MSGDETGEHVLEHTIKALKEVVIIENYNATITLASNIPKEETRSGDVETKPSL